MASKPLQLWHVCRFDLARRLRSVSGIVSLAVLVIVSSLVGRQLAAAAAALEKASEGQNAEAFGMLLEMVAAMTDFPLETVRETLELHSPPLVGAFAFLMLVMPVLSLTMGYDQCASDIETRHARYLAFRIDRVTLYLGKLLGAWAIVSLALSTAAISMAVYIWVRAGSAPEPLYLVRIIVTVSVCALPLLTFLGLLGTLRGRARRVALLAILSWLAVGLASGAARHWLELEVLGDAVEFLWPTNGQWALVFDGWQGWLISAARVVGYAVVVGALGLLHFRRRDL